jgi:cobalt-zinc-cadmium efflux system membrane fusion protein
MWRKLSEFKSRFAVVVGVALVLAAMAAYRPVVRWRRSAPREPTRSAPADHPSVELEPGRRDALRVTPEAVASLGVAVAPAEASRLADRLVLDGTLGIDPARLQEVRSRFAGEIVELGRAEPGHRPLQFGDAVKAGQLLAVLWSRELGEKKSELISALVQLNLDQTTLERLEPLFRAGSIPEREYREAARAVEVDRNELARITRTLEMWRVTGDELRAVDDEAARLIANQNPAAGDDAVGDGGAGAGRWARSEIRAAQDGLLLEFNAAVGDVVSSDDILFKVGDLTRLQVVAFAYEEDLPRLERLPADNRAWTVTVPAMPATPPQAGKIDRLGDVLDPVQHTVAVMGWVDNAAGMLRAGQFVSAEVAMPPPGDEVAIPASAVIERGGETLIFVQQDADPVFELRRVSLARVVGAQACIRQHPSADGATQGLQPGEHVVASGAVELHQALTDLQAARSQAAATEHPAP